MVRKNLKTEFLMSAFLAAFLIASPAFAFSVGDIEIKSKFGEAFDASFEIYLDHEGTYEVILGDVSDYKKLGLVRPSLMNFLVLQKPVIADGIKKIIHVSSQNPLFFPSFNLVILAKHNGGTLLENFLVTVDFHKGLALNAQGKKKKKTVPTLPEIKSAKKEILVEKEIISPAESDRSSDLPEPKEPKAPRKPEIEPARPNPFNKVAAIAPTAVVNHLQSRRMLSGAIWASPKKVPQIAPQPPAQGLTQPEETVAEKPKEPTSLQSENIIKLVKGEGLFTVARKIDVKNIHPARIAVALWMKNIDKFIYGNIHGIQPDTLLDKSGIEKLAAKINLQTAKNILNSQAQEWKLTREKPDEVENAETGVREVPLPSERMDQVASIFDWVSGWKSSWEENDIGKHIIFYREKENPSFAQESPAQENPVRERKKRLFLKFPNPSLKLSPQNLILKQGGAWVVFEQHFFSESLQSEGTKEVRLSWVEDAWKIDEEKFYAEKKDARGTPESLSQKNILPENNFPFVIHTSSHSNKPKAVSVSNNLRKNGFDSYIAPVRISKDIKIYRVYIGRFANWNQAHRVVQTLRRERLAGHATASPYPFTLQVGEVDSIVKARELLEKLRSNGISGFLSISRVEPKGMQFAVFVGAFKKPENAVWLMQRLQREGFNFKQISP